MRSLRFAIATLSLSLSSTALLHAERPAPVAGPGETSIAAEIDIHSSLPAKRETATVSVSRTPQVAPVRTGEQQSSDPYKTADRAWKGSLAALIGANSLDVISSWGKHESNPLLRSSNGTFGLRGLGIKSTIVGASLAPQLALRDHKELKKTLAIVNFAETAFFSTVAFHNFGLPAAKVLK